jgi:hypothetical protein
MDKLAMAGGFLTPEGLWNGKAPTPEMEKLHEESERVYARLEQLCEPHRFN